MKEIHSFAPSHVQKYAPVPRFLIYHLNVAANFRSRKLLQKFCAKIWACIKISNWPNIYYLHIAVNFRARKLLQNFMQKYESVLRFVIDQISITYMLQPNLGLENCYKFLCKHKIFLTWVYMIFKYGKRFRFAPSLNYLYIYNWNAIS